MHFAGSVRRFYELQPILPSHYMWQVLLWSVLIVAMVVVSVWLSLRDSKRLPFVLRALLLFLRMTAIACAPGLRIEPGATQRNQDPETIAAGYSPGQQPQHGLERRSIRPGRSAS